MTVGGLNREFRRSGEVGNESGSPTGGSRAQWAKAHLLVGSLHVGSGSGWSDRHVFFWAEAEGLVGFSFLAGLL